MAYVVMDSSSGFGACVSAIYSCGADRMRGLAT